ncbi:hypothetical protein TNCV_3990771 [Trichonephila clavipes]|uniref:Uncharacterized protein n=1 Tax=Trichonephila clavipes TaxID=2585209 RepID=A0A8X6T813_TRICX|nr:hypothetical protein TNCV_3990771 [Trichonephila clavipes]
MNGCVAAISVDTGKVLDIEVLSSYCPTFTIWFNENHHLRLPYTLHGPLGVNIDIIGITGLSPDEIANLLLSESNCEESEESEDVIPVNPDIDVSRDGTEWIPHNCNVPGRLVTRNGLRQSSGRNIMSTSVFYDIKGLNI